jgi:hypothetical protein
MKHVWVVLSFSSFYKTVLFKKNQILSTFVPTKVAKCSGRIFHLMQPVVNKYNASDDDKQFFS